MNSVKSLMEAWQAACALERQAWEKVRVQLPGTEDFDPGAWQEWQDAIARSDTARNRMMAALRKPQK